MDIMIIIDHPQYGQLPNPNYDASLLKTSSIVPFSARIGPICLPRRKVETQDDPNIWPYRPGRDCTVIGWGFTVRF